MLKPGNRELRPLTTAELDPIEREIRAYAAAALSVAPATPLRALRATEKSQVFQAHSARYGPIVIKRHALAPNFARERWAYALLETSRCTPRLHASCAQRNLLVLGLESRQPRPNELSAMSRVARALGHLHGSASEVARQLARAPSAGEPCLEQPSWIADAAGWARFVAMVGQGAPHASDHLAIGDLNDSHVLGSRQNVLFCDLELFRLGAPSQCDFLMLQNVCDAGFDFARHRRALVDAYVQGRGATSERCPWSAADFEQQMDALEALLRPSGVPAGGPRAGASRRLPQA